MKTEVPIHRSGNIPQILNQTIQPGIWTMEKRPDWTKNPESEAYPQVEEDVANYGNGADAQSVLLRGCF